MKSPCLSCDRLGKSKNVPRCLSCQRKDDYLAALEAGPECRSDPAYNMDYSLPRMLTRQLGPVRPFSQMDLILTF